MSKSSPKKYGKVEEQTQVPLSNEQKAKQFINLTQGKIYEQLLDGKFNVNPTQRPPKLKVKLDRNNEEQFLQIEDIENSMKDVREHIQEQKQFMRQQQKVKKKRAQSFLKKIQKQKEQFKEKIKQNQQKTHVLYKRAFSESVLNQMRERLNQRIVDKRKDLQEKVKVISQRKSKRVESVTEKQIQYWQKLQTIQNKRPSVGKLPFLNPEDGLNKILRKKNSLAKSAKSTQLLKKKKYEDVIKSYLDKAKARKDDIKSSSERQHDFRIDKVISSNKMLIHKLNYSDRSGRASKPLQVNSYSDNKFKMLGDQYLKESLLKLKKGERQYTKEQEPREDHDGIMQVNAKYVRINNNQILSELKHRWSEAITKIEQGHLSKEKGLEILNSLEKRLDKIDINGVLDRLKRKYEVLNPNNEFIPENYCSSNSLKLSEELTPVQLPPHQQQVL